MKMVVLNQDLFELNRNDYCFVQCISSDFKMGKGIALQFNKQFNCKKLLVKTYGQRYPWSYSGIALKVPTVPVFVLITKERYWDKPTYKTLSQALEQLKTLCASKGVKKLAMPKIGCGLDKLDWSIVKKAIEEIFNDTDIEITVCSKE